jgi:hypothetical protein
MRFTKLDYCQYLLSSPINYTVKNLADHLDGVSHDRINRYLRGEKLTPRRVKQAPGYKTAQKALNRFISELIGSV